MPSLRENAMLSVEEIQTTITRRGMEDEEFRANLLADPKGTIADQLGISLPEIFDIVVHESEGTSLHIALPPDVNELDEDQLKAISAGNHLCTPVHG